MLCIYERMDKILVGNTPLCSQWLSLGGGTTHDFFLLVFYFPSLAQ